MTIGRIVIALQVMMITMVVSSQEKHAILQITASDGPVLSSSSSSTDDYGAFHVEENNMQMYQLQGEYTRMCKPAPAEGTLHQLSTLVCLDETDYEDLFAEVIIIRPEPNSYCTISIYQRASRIIKKGASAVIIDITNNEEAATEVRLFNQKPLPKPVVVLTRETDAEKLWYIVKNYKRAVARISLQNIPKDEGKVYFDLSIVLALLVIFCIICFFVIVKLKWHHRRRRQRQLSLTDVTRQIVTSMKTRPYQPELRRSTSCSHSVISMEDCPICLENYRDKEMLKVLPCGHEFHGNCVDKWLIPHRTCPMCKYNILENTAENDGSACADGRYQRVRPSATAGVRGTTSFSLPSRSNVSPVRTTRADRATSTNRVHHQTERTDRTSNQNNIVQNQRRPTRTSGPTHPHSNPHPHLSNDRAGVHLHNSIPTGGGNTCSNISPWSVGEPSNRPGNIWTPDYHRPMFGSVGQTGARRDGVLGAFDSEKPRALAIAAASSAHQHRRPHSGKKRMSSTSPPRAKIHHSGSSQMRNGNSNVARLTQRYLLQQNGHLGSSSESECEARRKARSVLSSIEPGYSSHWDADSERSSESEGQCRCSLGSNQGTHDSGSDIPSDLSSSVPNIYSETHSDNDNVNVNVDVGHSGKDPPCDSVSIQLEPAVLKTNTLSQSFPNRHFTSGTTTSKPAYLAQVRTHSQHNHHSDSNVSSIDTSDVSPFVSDCCNSGNSDSNNVDAEKQCHVTGKGAGKIYAGSKTCDCQYCKENVPFLLPGFYNQMGATSSSSCKPKTTHFQPKKYSAKTNYYVHHHSHQYHNCGCCKPSSGKHRNSASSKARKTSLEPLQKLTDAVHPEDRELPPSSHHHHHHQRQQQRLSDVEYSRPPKSPLPSSSVSPPTTRCNICRAHRSVTSTATSPTHEDYRPWRRNTQPLSRSDEASGEGYNKCQGATKDAPRKALAVLTESQGVFTVPLTSYKKKHQNLGHMV